MYVVACRAPYYTFATIGIKLLVHWWGEAIRETLCLIARSSGGMTKLGKRHRYLCIIQVGVFEQRPAP